MTLAGYTDFACSDWSCKRVATQFRDYYGSRVADNRDALQALSNGLICNVHAGALKRRSGFYRTDETLLPLEEKLGQGAVWASAGIKYLSDRKAKRDESIARANEQRAQNQLEAQARFAQAWVERSTEADWDIVPGTEFRTRDDHFRDGFTITQVGDHQSSWNSTPIVVEQDGRAPAIVRVTSTGNYSPMKARAVAKALLMAADMADIRDTTNGPKVDE